MNIDQDKLDMLIEEEMKTFEQRTKNSLFVCQRAVNSSMPLGVPTNVCSLAPYPITVAKGEEAYVYDVDNNKYVDFHGGFGVNVTGHAHPFVVDAVRNQVVKGVHFGAMNEPVVSWSEHLCDRYGLDWIRFCQSGTEATMDALRLAKAKTGRNKIAKIEGGYHGSHDYALISMNMSLDENAGEDDAPKGRFGSEGLTDRLLEEVVVLPFNDLQAAEKALENEDVACILVEPILMNVGTISPKEGYLQGLRDLCDRTGSLLIFDETKTGATVAWGGASELLGVTPHIKTLGKGIGGGLPCAALGDTDGECFSLIEEFKVPHLGTFGGNPLVAAAGLAAMEDVLTPAAYQKMNEFTSNLSAEINKLIERYDLPAYTTSMGAKGCIVWSETKLENYRDWARNYNMKLGYLTWLFMVNRNIFLAPGQDEQYTISVFHGQKELEAFVDVFHQLCEKLSG